MYPNPIVANRAPTTADMAQIGQLWITTAAAPTSPSSVFIEQSVVNNAANWINLTATSGAFTALTVTGPSTFIGSLTQTDGNVSMGADATTQTVAIGTGAAAKTVTIGSTNTTSTTTIQAGTGGLSLSAAGNVAVTPVTATSATTTAVANGRVVQATYTGQTTAAAGTLVLTLTNSSITATNALLMTITNGGTNSAEMTVQRIQQNAGSATITLLNNGAAALNGNVLVTSWSLN
jgi:hypothetical protein